MKTLELRPPTVDALTTEHDQNLRKGRVFVMGYTDLDTAGREVCELMIVHPESGAEFRVGAEAVFANDQGVGLDLVGLDAGKKDDLARFVGPAAAGDSLVPPEPESSLESASRAGAATLPGAESDVPRSTPPPSIYERVRHLNTRERDHLARHGSISERVALERAFGGVVWEGLLQNAQITSPEVARMAKMGVLPKPLVSTIVANPSWLASGEVQRALLSNPRCAGGDLDRVLRAMRPADVARLAQQCPYRPDVRSAAARLAPKK